MTQNMTEQKTERKMINTMKLAVQRTSEYSGEFVISGSSYHYEDEEPQYRVLQVKQGDKTVYVTIGDIVDAFVGLGMTSDLLYELSWKLKKK